MSVAVAALLDATIGEPPARWHPVVAMGAWLDAAGRRVPPRPPARAAAAGALGWVGGATLTAAAAWALDMAARRLPPPVGVVVRGGALATLGSGRMLLDEVAAVETALRVGAGGGAPGTQPRGSYPSGEPRPELSGEGLAAGRQAVARLVSRPVADLDADEVREAALESLAENLSDSVVAPLLWYLLAGLPGAAVYRYANTADAMWGYRDERWRWGGTVAARADDLLNAVPARLTAAALAGRVVAWPELTREARRTPSPNAGWPMAALALRLGIRLGKRGAWTLHAAGRRPAAADATAALRHARGVMLGAAAAAAAVDLLTGGARWRR